MLEREAWLDVNAAYKGILVPSMTTLAHFVIEMVHFGYFFVIDGSFRVFKELFYLQKYRKKEIYPSEE
uniref:Uncharacterized protein n=1 Tax=Picea glauca TaxID=3330 RepID=A0A101M3H1_PICGL|nr:hypothetical protein ABT39_MTgene45 [Picea glauca]